LSESRVWVGTVRTSIVEVVAWELSGAKLNITPLPDVPVPEFRSTATRFCTVGTITTSILSRAEASVAADIGETARKTNKDQAASDERGNFCLQRKVGNLLNCMPRHSLNQQIRARRKSAAQAGLVTLVTRVSES
jgi:hypothetical protein